MINSREVFTSVEQNGAEQREKLLTFVDLAPVEFGQEILVSATRTSEEEHSTIKLVTKSPNLAFHFCIRKEEIVLNHREGEKFDETKEERVENLCNPNYKHPVKSNRPFLFKMFMSDEKFHISIDEKCFCTFKYRMPISEITRIELENLINITQVDQRSLHPGAWPPAPCISSDIVFSNDIPCQFKQSHITIITGKVISNGESEEGNFDIHFLARNTSRVLFLMRISFENGTVDLKAMDEEGKYVNEETKNFPFMCNEIFRIGISCAESEFRIAIDGQEFCNYTYVDKDIHHKMTGFKVKTTKALKFDIYSVEHKFSPNNIDNISLLTELPVAIGGEKEENFRHFFGRLSCPPQFSNSIIVAGTADIKSTKPVIQLETRDKETIALALVVDFEAQMITRNTQKDGKWGSKETTENLFDPKSPNPIIPGKEFKICFACGRDKFFISINDRSYCTYKYRLRLGDIIQVRVKNVQKVRRFDHHTVLPSPWPLHREFPRGKDFSSDIPVKFTPGYVVVIGGVPTGKGWFIINFYDPVFQRNYMHFNVRFNENIVVRAWKNEKCEFTDREDSGPFPFRLNRRFRMAAGFKKDRFVFAVNGKKFCEYSYHDKVLDKATGFKIIVEKGLTIKIHEVAHCHLDPECKGIERLSAFCQFCPETSICPN